ncbi:MAG: RDD family protein [Planctomycetota bacterium]|nr:MAG: RDD family protein [Planctomycetota bacterium]
MPKLAMQTAEGVTLELDLAGAGSRFAAGLIDGMLILTITLGFLVLAILLGGVDVTGFSNFVLGLVGMGNILFLVAYNVVFPIVWDGQTPGKRVMGLRIVSAEGHPATRMQMLVRGLLWIVDVLVLVPISIGVLLIAVTEKRQRLGDIVAGTLVAREAPLGVASEPWPRESWTGLVQRHLALGPAVLEQLDGEDLAFLREVITRRGIEEFKRRPLLRRVAKHYLDRLGLEQAADPRTVLKELYLFLREQRGVLQQPSAGS